jgi:hypothetical protein
MILSISRPLYIAAVRIAREDFSRQLQIWTLQHKIIDGLGALSIDG